MQRRPLLLCLGSSLLAALSLPARAADDGEFVILGARYGTERGHVDVTARLRELAQGDRRFKLENGLFGVDPDPGQTKTLRIFARDRQGQERTFEYREYDWVDGAQFTGWGRGNWGEGGDSRGWQGRQERRKERREERREERRDDGEFTIQYATYGAGGRDVDVTARLRELARRDQRVRLTNDLFGVDPLPGQNKTLRIFARDRGGQERVFEYREYGTIDGSQFTGWSRGEWGRDRGPTRPGGAAIVIEKASYGSGNRRVDVTQALRARVRGDRFEAEVTNDLLGTDPAPRRRKDLSVTFRVGKARSRTIRVNEGDVLRLP